MTPEDKVKKKITDYCDQHDIYWERRQAMAIAYRKGLPDLWMIVGGKHLECEVKAPGGSRSNLQYQKEKLLVSHGAEYICADNLDDFVKKVEELLQ